MSKVLHQPQESIPNQNSRKFNKIFAVVGGVAVLAGASQTGALDKIAKVFGTNTINPKTDPTSGEKLNTNTVVLRQGARIRFAPIVANPRDGDSLASVIDQEITLNTPSGVNYIDRPGSDNDWIGIDTSDIAFSANDSELLDAARQDKSGTVWVSTQKADIGY